jgi:hypothetical protein
LCARARMRVRACVWCVDVRVGAGLGVQGGPACAAGPHPVLDRQGTAPREAWVRGAAANGQHAPLKGVRLMAAPGVMATGAAAPAARAAGAAAVSRRGTSSSW